jgi:hypothetical protein
VKNKARAAKSHASYSLCAIPQNGYIGGTLFVSIAGSVEEAVKTPEIECLFSQQSI